MVMATEVLLANLSSICLPWEVEAKAIAQARSAEVLAVTLTSWEWLEMM